MQAGVKEAGAMSAVNNRRGRATACRQVLGRQRGRVQGLGSCARGVGRQEQYISCYECRAVQDWPGELGGQEQYTVGLVGRQEQLARRNTKPW